MVPCQLSHIMSYLPVLDSMKKKELKSVVFKFVKFSGVAFFLHNEAELQGLLSQ